MTMHFEIKPTDALVLIDMQNDFCPGGALAVQGGDEIIATINALAKKFNHAIATEDWHPQGHVSFASAHEGKRPFTDMAEVSYGAQALWPDHCVQNTRGAELHPSLAIDNLELILRKGFRREIDSYSAFLENDHATATGLAGYLQERGLQRLFFCGLAFDYCVGFSALDGAELGFECVVIEDATRGIAEASMHDMRRRLSAAGVLRVNSKEI